MPKYLAIALTSIGGAVATVAGLAILFGKLKVADIGTHGSTIGAIQDLAWGWAAAAVVLAVIGIVAQTRSTLETEVVAYGAYRNPGMTSAV